MSDRDAFRANRDVELKTPDEWCVELGIEILDPDGWRGKNGRPWTDPITRKEFKTRSIICTQRRVTPADRAEMQAARAAGLKARHETREARAAIFDPSRTYAPDATECAKGHPFASEADCLLPDGWDNFMCRACVQEAIGDPA